MTILQVDKLKLYLQKTADLALPLAALEATPFHSASTPPTTNYNDNTASSFAANVGASGGVSALQNATTPFAKPSMWKSLVSSPLISPSGIGAALTNVAKGGLQGIGYGAISHGLPIIENGLESSVGYTPSNNVLSNAYSGIPQKDVSSLYLDHAPDQQPGSPTRTWGNWLDQSMTSGGGIKNTVNDAAAGSVWGGLGSVLNSIPNALSNIYSAGKGVADLMSVNSPKNQISRYMQRMENDETEREASQNAPQVKQSEFQNLKNRIRSNLKTRN